MKVLVTGAQGQLGVELCSTICSMESEVGLVPSQYENAVVDAVDHLGLDIADGDAVQAWFAAHGPYDVVFNCAAHTNVDACERDEEAAYAVNATGVENLARACRQNDSVLVHVSTDYVFSGKDSGARVEGDACSPVSAYGRTKLAGERLALANNRRTHIVRTAWLYGAKGSNFVRTMVRLGSAAERVTVVSDQMGNPTNTADLVCAMLRIALSNSYGIWHATCQGDCSWAVFAEAIMDEFDLDCRVDCCTTEQWCTSHPQAARRPAFSSLDNKRLRFELVDDMRPWREALHAFAAKCIAEKRDE